MVNDNNHEGYMPCSFLCSAAQRKLKITTIPRCKKAASSLPPLLYCHFRPRGQNGKANRANATFPKALTKSFTLSIVLDIKQLHSTSNKIRQQGLSLNWCSSERQNRASGSKKVAVTGKFERWTCFVNHVLSKSRAEQQRIIVGDMWQSFCGDLATSRDGSGKRGLGR